MIEVVLVGNVARWTMHEELLLVQLNFVMQESRFVANRSWFFNERITIIFKIVLFYKIGI